MRGWWAAAQYSAPCVSGRTADKSRARPAAVGSTAPCGAELSTGRRALVPRLLPIEKIGSPRPGSRRSRRHLTSHRAVGQARNMGSHLVLYTISLLRRSHIFAGTSESRPWTNTGHRWPYSDGTRPIS